MAERVTLQTKDQVLIVGSFMSTPEATRAALLLHMMPADHTSWRSFQEALARRGVASLAIDLRGHGESTVQNGHRIDYKTFSDDQHQASIEDVRAALQWLKTRGFSSAHVALIGASIGANLALNAAAEQSEIPAIALLSPGENYRGVTTYHTAGELHANQALWATGSQGDDEESFQAAKRIIELAPSKEKLFKPYTAAGHGTLLLQNNPQLAEELANWVARHVE